MAKKRPAGPQLPFDDLAVARPSAAPEGPSWVPPDADARRRIATDLRSSLLVEAGAGSGKTHELASRMAAGVASGAFRIEHMVAVTFTRKAAAELRGRFQIALEERLKTADDDAAARIIDALASIETFFAGTIHAFCARLLRERPVEAGVAPGFVELDDAEDRLLREESWRDYRSQAVAAGNPHLLQLDEADVKPRQLDEAFNVVCLYEEVDFPSGDVSRPDVAPVWQALEAFWAEMVGYLERPIDHDTSCRTQQAMDRFGRDWQFFGRIGGAERRPAVVAALLGHWDFAPKITQNRWSADAARKKRLGQLIPERHQAFRDGTVVPFLTAWREYLYSIAVRVLVDARERAALDRRQRNVLSFNDLLGRTAAMLRTKAQVRRAMQQKYRWLFVDEFQDTDPLQAEVIFLLAADEPAPSADRQGDGRPAGGAAPGGSGDEAAVVDWRAVSVRPGALFVVGDPKQSIYRFTRADIDIYNQVRARLGGPDGHGVVQLTTNFRSRAPLCEWANGVFTGLFPDEATSHSPQYAPLVPAAASTATGRRDPTRISSGPGSLFTLTTVDGDVAEEAERIARYIRSEVAGGRRAAGDFLILTRKKRHLQVYADALEQRQLPVEVSGGSGFNQSAEVRQLALLLLALTDPQDQVALVGVLRGALFGLSDQQLFAWKQAGGYVGLFATLEAGVPAEAEPVAAALEALRRWFRWARMLPAGAALERILDDSGYLALAAADAGGVDAGDLLHAIDRVRAVVETGFTLFEAAVALASWSKLDDDGPDEAADVESLPLEPGRPDVVRVMNLHKAKGLEAKVVILADPAGGFTPHVSARIVRDPHAASRPVGFFQIREPGKWGPASGKPIAQPADWTALETEERAYLDAEETRLLYVAATRAKEVLVICRSAQKPRTPAWAAFDAHLTDVPELPVPDVVADEVPLPTDFSDEAVAAADRAIELAHGAAVKPTWAATSVTAEAKRFPSVVPGGQEEAASDDPTRVVTAETPSRRADAGLAWGTLVHGLLEHAMRFPASTPDDLRRLARWFTVEEPTLAPLIDQAIGTVLAVRASERLASARASAEHHEEAPFGILETRDGMPTVVTGTIDLVHRTPDGWRVIDYKTDVDEGALADRYAVQVEGYRQAWTKVAGGPVTKEIIAARRR